MSALESQREEFYAKNIPNNQGCSNPFVFKMREWKCVKCGCKNFKNKLKCSSNVTDCDMTAEQSMREEWELLQDNSDDEEGEVKESEEVAEAYFQDKDDLLPDVNKVNNNTIEFKYANESDRERKCDTQALMKGRNVTANDDNDSADEEDVKLFSFTTKMIKSINKFITISSNPATAAILPSSSNSLRCGGVIVKDVNDGSIKCLWNTELDRRGVRCGVHCVGDVDVINNRTIPRPSHIPLPLDVTKWVHSNKVNTDVTTVYEVVGNVTEIIRLRARVKCTKCGEFLMSQVKKKKDKKKNDENDGVDYSDDMDIDGWFNRPLPDCGMAAAMTMPLSDLSKLVNTSESYKTRTLRYERDRAYAETIMKCKLLLCPSRCPKRFAKIVWDVSAVLEDGCGRLIANGEGGVAQMLLNAPASLCSVVEAGAWEDPRGVEFSSTAPLANSIEECVRNGVALEASDLARYKLHVACKEQAGMWSKMRRFYVSRSEKSGEKGKIRIDLQEEVVGEDDRVTITNSSKFVSAIKDPRVSVKDVQDIDADAMAGELLLKLNIL
jgi:hypothetical protein